MKNFFYFKPFSLLMVFPQFSGGFLSAQDDAPFELIPQMIHEYALNDLAYAPDGLAFASASYDRVILWEVNTGKQIRVFPGMGKGFTSLAFSPDGSLLAAGATDKSVVLWDRASGVQRQILPGHPYAVLDIAFSPDGQTLASVATQWAGREKDEIPAPDSRASALLQQAGKVASVLNKKKSGEVRIWDLATGRVLRTLPEEVGAIEPICFSPDGRSIATGAIDFTLGQWDLETGQLMRIYGKHNNLLQAVAFTPDGTGLAAAYWGKDMNQKPSRGLQIWNVADGSARHGFSHYTGFVSALAFSPNGRFLATAANDLAVFLPEKRRRSASVLPLNDQTGFSGERLPFEKFKAERNRARAIKPDGSFEMLRHPSKGSMVSEIKLWRTADGADLGNLYRGSSPVYTLAFSPDSKFVVADSEGHSIRRWRIEPASDNTVATSVEQSVQGLTADILDMVYSPDGGMIANLDGSSTFRVWDVKNLREIRLFRGHKDKVNAVAFSTDSQRIASASEDKTIKIWDLGTRELLKTLNCEHYPRALAFSPDGKHLVSLEWPHLGLRFAVDKKLIWWDLASGEKVDFQDRERWKIEKAKYNRISFSADGAFLLLSAGYRALGRYEFPSEAPTDLWEVALGRPVQRFPTCDAADFGKLGRHILTAKGASLTVWDAQTHRRIHDLVGHELWSNQRFNFKQDLGISSVAISPDEGHAVSCATDKTLRLWSLETGENLRTIKGRFQLAGFSPDGKSVLSADFDGRLQIWDRAALADASLEIVSPAVTLLGLPQSEEFIAFTPDLKYKSTRNGYRAIVVLKDHKAYGFDQFDALLNRPDLVVAALPGHDPDLVALYRQAYEKRLQRLGLKEEELALDFQLPEIVIHNDLAVNATKADRLELEVGIKDERQKLDRLLVRVNGVPLQGRRGVDLEQHESHSLKVRVTVPLGWGENNIEASVMNALGVESYRESVHLLRPGEPPKPNMYLVAVGVSDYIQGGGEKNLQFAAKDAIDLANLMEANRDLFGKVFTLTLTDEKATRENIRHTRAFLEQASLDDHVMLFMAGHGLLDGNRGFYYGTADIDFLRPAERGLAYEEIENLMDGLHSRRKLVVIDACHAGELEPDEPATGVPNAVPTGTVTRGIVELEPEDEPPPDPNPAPLGNGFDLMREMFVDLNRGSGAMVIASARGNEFAFESSEFNNGVFTHVLLEGLRRDDPKELPKADLDQNLQVDISELRAYTADRVKQLTHGRQSPTFREEALNFNYPLLQLPVEKLGPLKKAIVKTKKLANKGAEWVRDSITEASWEDEKKPKQFWGDYGWLLTAPTVTPGKPLPPSADSYPLPASEYTNQQRRNLRPRFPPSHPRGFWSCYKGGLMGEFKSNQTHKFPRVDRGSGQLHLVYLKEALSMEQLIQKTLQFDYTQYSPVHKQFLQHGRIEIVQREVGQMGDREVTYLVTRSSHDSARGSLVRIYYHMLYSRDGCAIRLTTAGGHSNSEKDIESFVYSPSFDAAVRSLFYRFIFPYDPNSD